MSSKLRMVLCFALASATLFLPASQAAPLPLPPLPIVVPALPTDCGLLETRVGDVTLGLDCMGYRETFGWTCGAPDPAGGRNCTVSASVTSTSSLRIHAGGFDAALTVSGCRSTGGAGWGAVPVPLTVGVGCVSETFHVAKGQCVTVFAIFQSDVRGDHAPPGFHWEEPLAACA